VIGGYLTEVNVTSPTGIREIDRLNNVSLGQQVIKWLESFAGARLCLDTQYLRLLNILQVEHGNEIRE